MSITLPGLLQLFVALPLALGFVVVVLRSGAAGTGARALLAMLVLEGAGQGLFGLVRFTPERGAIPLAAVGIVLYAWASFSYLLLVRTLKTPLVGPLRSSRVLFLAGAAVGGPATAHLLVAIATGNMPDVRTTVAPSPDAAGFVVSLFATVAVGVYALAASIDALRRSPPGSGARIRARAFLAAFATRDALFALATAISASAAGPRDAGLVLWPLATVLFIPLATYGILSSQLFDIDLRIKWTIRRGTVATIVLVAVFAVAKAAETYLHREVGLIAGSLVAGSLLVVVPKLNRIGERVADVALPQVQPTNAYLAFKKLEVYRAALEAAAETGGITPRERAALERLREKLGITPAEAEAVESDANPPRAAGGGRGEEPTGGSA